MVKWSNLRIPSEHGSYYKSIWLELADGGSDQWLYVCRDGLAYIFLEVLDYPAVCGRDAPALFDASVCVVDLLTTPLKTIVAARDSCGCDDDLDLKKELGRLQVAEMLFSHGAKSPMWNSNAGVVKDLHDRPDESHPAFRKLRAEARRYAEENLFSDEQRNELLDNTIVNKIGQTAREYAQGADAMWSALRRIKEDGEDASPEQQLVLKMYQNAETTLGAGPIPEDIKKGSQPWEETTPGVFQRKSSS